MTTIRAALLSLVLVCAAPHTAQLLAQAAADTSRCTYSRCALRVEYRWLSTRLVRGASGESVGRLGWFGSGVDVLLAGPDSAAHHARLYRSRRTTSDLLGVIGGALAFAGVLQAQDPRTTNSLILVGITLDLVALPFFLNSRRSLERAIWWYNRDLPRP